MQFRFLPVAVALLAVVVVVLAVDQPGETVEALHSKCYHHDGRHWIAENEEPDEEAMRAAFPSNYEAMGWRKYRSGKCSYKRRYVDCPRKRHWHHDEYHWDHQYGFTRLHHPCTYDKECCSNLCLQVHNTTSSTVCCKQNTLPFNSQCSYNWQCCSGNCGANPAAGSGKFCLDPVGW